MARVCCSPRIPCTRRVRNGFVGQMLGDKAPSIQSNYMLRASVIKEDQSKQAVALRAMGLAMGRLPGLSYRLTKQLRARILMFGLDAAGKTTILYRLKTGEVASAATVATVAFNIETIEYKGISFTFWDVAGSAWNRPLWKYYFHGTQPATQGVVFVVDSSDRDRIRLAREELNALLNDEELRDAALLVLANKQDLPNAMTAAEMAQELGLHQSSSLGNNRHRRWHIIQSSCAPSSREAGLCEGMDWLCTNINIQVG